MANQPPGESNAQPPEPAENRLCLIGDFADLQRVLSDLHVALAQVVSVVLTHENNPGDGAPQTKFTVTYKRAS